VRSSFRLRLSLNYDLETFDLFYELILYPIQTTQFGKTSAENTCDFIQLHSVHDFVNFLFSSQRRCIGPSYSRTLPLYKLSRVVTCDWQMKIVADPCRQLWQVFSLTYCHSTSLLTTICLNRIGASPPRCICVGISSNLAKTVTCYNSDVEKSMKWLCER
jgi:hypothetical protein